MSLKVQDAIGAKVFLSKSHFANISNEIYAGQFSQRS